MVAALALSAEKVKGSGWGDGWFGDPVSLWLCRAARRAEDELQGCF